jgi:hypothetical protein
VVVGVGVVLVVDVVLVVEVVLVVDVVPVVEVVLVVEVLVVLVEVVLGAGVVLVVVVVNRCRCLCPWRSSSSVTALATMGSKVMTAPAAKPAAAIRLRKVRRRWVAIGSFSGLSLINSCFPLSEG